MMKKNILYFSLVLIIAGLWRNSQTGFASRPTHPIALEKPSLVSGNKVLQRDQEKLERNIKPENLTNNNWDEVNDYAKSANSIVNKKNAKDYFSLTASAIADLAACLKKDYCGMEKRNESDAYFDNRKTPGHILLGRNLDLMIESLRLTPELSKNIDWELIEELTESENDKIKVSAIKLMKKYNSKNNETEKLLKIVDNYKGNAKADALAEIAARNSKSDREALSQAIEKSFAEDDPNTVISIVEKLKKMRLTDMEVQKISKNLCHYKESGDDDHNWKMIKYDMRGITDMDKVCN